MKRSIGETNTIIGSAARAVTISRRMAIALALAWIGANGAYAQGMYRWVDKDGKVYYSDKKPADKPRNVEERQVRGSVVETTVPGYALQQAIKANPVSLYTAPECKEPCADARALLQKRGVPFKEISVADNQMREELVKVGGAAEVPLMLVGSNKQKGFEAGAYTAALDQAGYPQSAGPARALAAPAAVRNEGSDSAKAAAGGKSEGSVPKGRYLP